MKRADIIFYNANVYTVDETFSISESFAIKDGKFVDIGSNEEILHKYDPGKKINLQGKFVYPGFIDAHCHFYRYALGLQRANLKGTKSVDEVIQVLKKHHETYPSVWIIGRGWDQNDWKIKEFPDKKELDSLFPDNPVFLKRRGGHMVLVNSEALRRAGITKATKIEGGKIEIKNGELTGILIDNALESVKAVIPGPDLSEKKLSLLEAANNCFAVGLTSIGDAGLNKEIIELIDSLQKENRLNMRIYAMLAPTEENFERFMYRGRYKTAYLNVRSVKLFADGALGSRSARLIEPYSDDPGNYGILAAKSMYYREMCRKAIDYGYQVNTHAIGDSAVRLMLNIYGEFLKGPNDLRWRIEHSQVVHLEDFRIYERFGIIPSVQTSHAAADMNWAEQRLGPDRIKGAYAYKKLLAQNGWLPNGSDFPFEDINPLYGFYSAISRKNRKGFPKNGFLPENALTRKEALKAMTIWAARSSFDENEKGSIEKGKFADFVVTGEDIMEIDEFKLPQVKIIKTFVGGEEVYSLL